jgi:hypothetical protein
MHPSTEISRDDSKQKMKATPNKQSGSQKTLTAQQARDIFELKDMPSSVSMHAMSVQVAKMYRVSSKAIRDIWTGRSWLDATYDLWDPSDRPERKMMGRPKGSRDKQPRKRKETMTTCPSLQSCVEAKTHTMTKRLMDQSNDKSPQPHDSGRSSGHCDRREIQFRDCFKSAPIESLSQSIQLQHQIVQKTKPDCSTPFDAACSSIEPDAFGFSSKLPMQSLCHGWGDHVGADLPTSVLSHVRPGCKALQSGPTEERNCTHRAYPSACRDRFTTPTHGSHFPLAQTPPTPALHPVPVPLSHPIAYITPSHSFGLQLGLLSRLLASSTAGNLAPAASLWPPPFVAPPLPAWLAAACVSGRGLGPLGFV